MGLLDVLQSASNSVADTVAGPVDILSLLLRKGGIPIPDEPVGGSEWMKRKGLMRDVPMGAERIAGETIGLLAPTAIAAKAPQIARGLLKAQENALAPRTLSPEAGVIVYQGSPHKYDAEKLVKLKDGNLAYVGGKFNALKEVPPGATVVDDFPLGRIRSEAIGTGEGAQAYGHGSYLAESREVGAEYAKNLANRDARNQGRLNAHANAQRLAGLASDPKYAADDIRYALETQPDHPQAKLLQDTLALLESGGYKKPLSNLGFLYKADLPDEWLPKMLDWDKPLSQQANVMDLIGKNEAARTIKVLNAKKATLQNLGNDHPNAGTLKNQIILLEEEVASPSASGLGTLTGGDYYNYLRRRDVDPKSQAEMFRSAGIPGIRYLDGGSRGAGQGTYNYVVFPGLEDQIKILERNGVPLGLLGR
jgi:hypothetical protein